MNQKPEIIIYTCGSELVVDYIEVCLKNDFIIKAIIRNQGTENASFDSVDVNSYNFKNEHTPFIIPLFVPFNRYKAVQEALNHGLKPYSLLSDRNNDLPIKFKYGTGNFINKRVVIGAETRLGDYICINRGACLGHHVVLEDFTSIGPGVVTGGLVTLERGAMIGAGATILPKVKIGKHSIVGAGSVVTKDVPPNSIVVGNPAKVIKTTTATF